MIVSIRKNIESPLFFIDFRVEPDPSKAVKLSVTFDSKASCVVGELLPGKIPSDVYKLTVPRNLRIEYFTCDEGFKN